MSSLSALKYKISTDPSVIAKVLAITLLLLSAIILYLLWGVGWFSALLLIIYILVSAYFVCSSVQLPFSCLLSDAGHIEISEPKQLIGVIDRRSFYNAWVMFLCVEQVDALLVEVKHDNPRKWFIVFYDSVTEQEYRLLARLINTAYAG
ncbi:protein YgfX [Psychromonas sp. KJ10-2]|uniref:protein YgfX n=1 Tax=Psychromonas sp. KJ10-2 TaxID=3391822 RepID=UPI0039B6A358